MTTVLEKEAVQADISPEEVQRRVAILKRFRELLSQQRDRFRQYMNVLDKQKDVIEKGNAEALIVHVEMEEKIVSDIFAIQKVIDPLEAMYQASFPVGRLSGSSVPLSGGTRDNSRELQAEVPSLRKAVEDLRAEAVIRSGRNRELLAKRMEEIRQDLKVLMSNPYAPHRSVYSEGATLVDIAG
jgi:septal ring factor EnvC (AmiA/AmiB activator)